LQTFEQTALFWRMVAVYYIFLLAVLAVPAALITAVLALLFRRSHIASRAPHTTLIVIGTIIPAVMVARGIYLSWPWPWHQTDVMQDGIPAGPWLIMASMPSWALCLAVSRLFGRR
jgi:hypothetical protein